jgi:hypothetical protein
LFCASTLVACGGGSSTSTATADTTTSTGTETTSTAIDPTRLPIGDGKTSTTTAQVGYVYTCGIGNIGGSQVKGPWFNADGTTWNSTTKLVVQGAVSWVSEFTATLSGTVRNITGNGLPNHTTGVYPIATSDPIYQYDGNGNRIAAQTIAWGLPGNPQVASKPSCLPGGAIGIFLTGAKFFNALDGSGRDAVAHEGQDSCQGHPDPSSSYHYHSLSSCVPQKDTAGQHSPLVGYVADGFGIYGNLGESGSALTNADLDECHGHTHSITVDGQQVTQYHYHATKEYPYTVGCFKGTAVSLR